MSFERPVLLYMCVCIDVYMCVTDESLQSLSHIFVYVCAYVYVHISYAYMCVCVYIYIYIYIYIYTHTHIHTYLHTYPDGTCYLRIIVHFAAH